MSEFYIGWSEGNTDAKQVKNRFFLVFLSVMFLVLILFTLKEKPFSNSQFFYGELSTIEGELLPMPVVSLRVEVGEGFEIVPLVGFGKMGPQGALENYLDDKTYHLKLEGTLIEYNGHKVFELTNGASSVLESKEIKSQLPEGKMGSMMTVRGEIVDPKCFFGVMKPGYGKVHRSCAIRCISGQIPPILAVRENGQFMRYYFIADAQGNVLMTDLHDYVGRTIEISGISFEFDNWKSIRMESVSTAYLDETITLCSL